MYRDAGTGYLFHNTDGLTSFESVHRAMWVLSGLYDDARSVWAIRIDANTVMASFNTQSIVKPIAISRGVNNESGYEWVSKNQPKGWLVANIRDPKTSVEAIDYDSMYDGCLQLERTTGHCPCPRMKDGTCLTSTLFRVMPEMDLAEFAPVETAAHQVQRYKNVASYEYKPGLYMVDAAFVESLRPWDNYDFALIPEREKEFRDRGKSIVVKNNFRKAECAQCVFRRGSTDNVLDCGRINSCDGHAVEADAEKALENWFYDNTPFAEGSEGFSKEEMVYLMTHAGKECVTTQLGNGSRNIAARLAGFFVNQYDTHLKYAVVAAKGNLSRRITFNSYAELRAAVPKLPPTHQLINNEIDLTVAIAHAVFAATFAHRYTYYRYGKGEPWHIAHDGTSVSMYVQNNNRWYTAVTYRWRDQQAKLFQLLWPELVVDAAEMAANPNKYSRPFIGWSRGTD